MGCWSSMPLWTRPVVERLERRRHLSAAQPPRVEDVHVSGSAWSQEFVEYFDEHSVGNAPHGFRIATSYAMVLPWLNVNRITIRTTYDMIVEADDLRVRGVASPTYPVTSVETSFDPDAFRTTATFTLAVDEFAKPDNLLFELDAGPNGVRRRDNGIPLDGDRNGAPGGDFVFRFTVLTGDYTGDRYIDQRDLLGVRKSLGRTIANPGTEVPFYHTFVDFNADGRINFSDMALVRSRLYTYAPFSAPTMVAADVAGARPRPVTRGLFSAGPILA